MKKHLFILFALLAIGFVGYQKWKLPALYHVKSYVFGTLVDISIAGEQDKHARVLANHILREFQSLHQRLHAWKPVSAEQKSELQQLNIAFSTQKSVPIASDLAGMLQDITVLSSQSNGFFNPAIGQLINAWGFQSDQFSATKVKKETIAALVQSSPKMSDILVEGHNVSSKNTAVQLDLGGYAKGYALDLAVQYLKAQHVKHALINIGGNIIALGQNSGRPWRVGIQHPRKPEALATLALLDGWAIGTSGDYQRYFMLDGKRYCHLINPNTGYPVQHTQAVTVLIPPQAIGKIQAGVLSDVASKPLFITPLDEKKKMATKLDVQHYLVVNSDGNVLVSPALAEQLTWVSEGMDAENL